jgi:hypothetical protein
MIFAAKKQESKKFEAVSRRKNKMKMVLTLRRAEFLNDSMRPALPISSP